MKYVHLIVLLIAVSSQTTFARGRRIARPNPMAELQNMVNGYNMPMPRNHRLPVETAMPVNRMDIPLPYMRNVEQKCPCQLEQPCPRVLPEMRVPEILKMQEIRRQEMPRIPEMRAPEVLTMQEMIRQEVARIPEMRAPEVLKMQDMIRQEVARMPEFRMPAPMITEMPIQYVPNMPVGQPIIMPAPARLIPEVMPAPARLIPEVTPTPARVIPEVIDMPVAIRNMPEVVNMPIIQERYECPCASPKALVNPFLPAASPVSAYAPPTSNLLPPAIPNLGRSHFLRKIPIPPPTL